MARVPYVRLLQKDPFPLPSTTQLARAVKHIEDGNCTILDCPFASEIIAVMQMCLKMALNTQGKTHHVQAQEAPQADTPGAE